MEAVTLPFLLRYQLMDGKPAHNKFAITTRNAVTTARQQKGDLLISCIVYRTVFDGRL